MAATSLTPDNHEEPFPEINQLSPQFRSFGRIVLRGFSVSFWLLLLAWLSVCLLGVVMAGRALYGLLSGQGQVNGTALEWTLALLVPIPFAVAGCIFIRFLQRRLKQFEELLDSPDPFGTRGQQQETQQGAQPMKDLGEATPAFSRVRHKWATVWRGGEPLQLVSKPGDSQLRFVQRMEPSVRVFGAVFLPVGMASVFAPFYAASFEGSKGAAVFVGLAFALIGALLLLGRRGITIDKLSNQVSTWWGLLVPMWLKKRALSAFSEVQVDKQRRETENGSYFVYGVTLISPSERPFPVFASPFQGESEVLAAEITAFLGLGTKSS